MKAITRSVPMKALAVLLTAALLLGLFPVPASAAGTGSADNIFTFTNSGVTASDPDGSGFKISGTTLKITAAGPSQGSIMVA